MNEKGMVFNIQKFSINDGPGIRSTIFFCGCPLSCRWCSNPESQNRYRAQALASKDPKLAGCEWTVEEVLAEVEKDRCFYEESGGGITLSGGEVLQQHSFAEALLKEAHKANLHCAAETTGFAPQDIFASFMQHIDLLLFDVKHWNREMHQNGTGVYNDIILENLQYAVQQKGAAFVIARIPVIPGFNNRILDAEHFSRLLLSSGIQEVHLLPFHQFGEKKYNQLRLNYELENCPQLHPEDLEDYREIFLQHGLKCSFQ